MAKRVQPAAAKYPQGESKPEERSWRNPTVIAAVIAGMAAIGVAIIGLVTPKSKLVEPTKIEQLTHGPGSPAIGHTGGNVTIHQQESSQKP